MSVTEFKRGVPTYKDKDNNEYGLLCETKEVCVTDNNGVSLEYKLQNLLQNINNIISGVNQVGNAKTLDGHEAEDFAKGTDLAKYLPLTGTSAKTLEVQADTVLKAKNTGGGDYTWLQFLNNVGTLGYFGFNKNKVPLVSIDGNPTALLHTGNMADHVLPKTGGTVGNGVDNYPIAAKGGSVYSFVEFLKADNTALGALGMYGVDKPSFIASGRAKVYELLHAGNSSKVVISQTAPSDTSALWVW